MLAVMAILVWVDLYLAFSDPDRPASDDGRYIGRALFLAAAGPGVILGSLAGGLAGWWGFDKRLGP